MRKTDNHIPSLLVCAGAMLMGTTAVRIAGAPQTPAATSAQLEFFEAKIRPLLVNSCFDCHTADEKGGLRLDSRQAVLKGGESGPAIVPGNPDASLLMKAVRHVQGVSKMPRSASKLGDTEIAALAEWITMGAPWPSATAATPAASKDAMAAPPLSAAVTPDRPIDPQLKSFWSFQPIRKPAVPQPKDARWAKND